MLVGIRTSQHTVKRQGVRAEYRARKYIHFFHVMEYVSAQRYVVNVRGRFGPTMDSRGDLGYGILFG